MTMAPPATVVLADDHPMLLKGLSDIIGAEADFEVVGAVLDGTSALALIRSLQPQIAVLDLAMPGLGGIEVLKTIAHDPFSPRVVILTALIDDQQILEVIASGVWGILLKESAPEALVDCLREVAMGRKQLPADMIEGAFSRYTAAAAQPRMVEGLLTAREHEVAMLVCEGLANVEIAQTLGLSTGTVRIYLHNIYTKLNIRNRTALAALILNGSGI